MKSKSDAIKKAPSERVRLIAGHPSYMIMNNRTVSDEKTTSSMKPYKRLAKKCKKSDTKFKKKEKTKIPMETQA